MSKLFTNLSSPEQAERTALTLALAAFGGFVFWLVGFPLAWLTGSATLVAALSISGKKLLIPRPLSQVAIAFIGAIMGSSVTPETLALLPRWPVTIAGLGCALMSIMLAGSYYLQRVHGYDRATARLCAMPGAMTQVMVLAIESQADARRVTIIQVMRLFAILLLLPAIATALGVHMAGTMSRPGSVVIAHQIPILAIAVGIGAWIFIRLRTPAPTLMGAMAASALLYGSGVLTTALPDWLFVASFVVIGAIIGTNFFGTDLSLFTVTVGAGLGSLVVYSLVALLWALPLAWLVGLSQLQVWLAYMPGGVEVSAIMAMALGLDVAFVSSHHILRVVMLSFTLPWWLRSASPPADNDEQSTMGDGRYY